MLTNSILSYCLTHNLHLRMFNEGTSILVAYTGAHFYIVSRNMLRVMAGTSNVPLLKHPDQYWGPNELLFNNYHSFFPEG